MFSDAVSRSTFQTGKCQNTLNYLSGALTILRTNFVTIRASTRAACVRQAARCDLDCVKMVNIYLLHRLQKIIVVLHRQPTLGRAAQLFRRPHCHFRANPTGSSASAIQGRSNHAQLGSGFATTDIVGSEVRRAKQLSRTGRIVRCHQR